MLAKLPPMGWNSWNTFGENISEQLIKETADVMAEQGYLEAGYEYLVIDDCWALMERDENGRLVPDPVKFPNGMKAVADYVHSKGLKFGMYSCAGIRTCAGYPSSYDHEYVDAQTFADWGVDFLKYDFCNFPSHANGRNRYHRMSMALKATGRDIVFSGCNWGTDDPWKWMGSIGVHMYRSTGDIRDNYKSFKDIALSQIDNLCMSGSGKFNDPDMLVVGMYGKGNVAFGGCTDEEYRTHFALWALLGSPLMIGCDIRDMNEDTKKILMNKDILAINQDAEVRTPYWRKEWDEEPETVIHMWKPLENGDYALGFFNFHDGDCSGRLQFFDMGLPTRCGYGLRLHDIWEDKDLGVFTDRLETVIPAHGCKMFRASLVEL